MIKGFVLGVIVVIVVAGIAGYVGITQGLLIPANADAQPGALETWAAKRSLHATLAREAPKTPNPVSLTDEHLVDGIKLYGANCVVCHGAADGDPSTVAIGLYQHAPQFSGDGVEDDPEGVTYWKIAHGIRLTGMPSYASTLTESQIWTVVLFLKHMDSLTPKAERAWKSLRNPVALAPASALPKKPDK